MSRKAQRETPSHSPPFFLGEFAGLPIESGQLAVVRKVYTALSISLLVTFLAGYLGTWIQPHSPAFWACILAPFAVLPFMHSAETDAGGLASLSALAFFEGLTLGCLYQVMAVEAGCFAEWWTAVGVTAAAFGGITAYVWATRDDFGWMQGALYNMLLASIVLGLTVAWGPMSFGAEMVWGVFGVGLFSAFILADTSDVLHRYGEKGAYVAACHLYLDILNLFLRVLRVLLRSRK